MTKENDLFILQRKKETYTIRNKRDRQKAMIVKTYRTLICVIFCILCIFPFYTVVVNSTLSSGDVQRGINFKIGSQFSFNFDRLIEKASNIKGLTISKAMLNSLIISVPSTALATYFSAMVAYGLHVYEFKLKKIAWAFIICVIMIPPQVSIIGFVKLMTQLGFYDSFLPLFIPAIAAPAVVFFLRQYMKSGLPLDMVEAARIDGSSEFRTFNMIAVPLIKPAIATQAILVFISTWNDLYKPSMMLFSPENTTLPMFVQILKAEQFRADYGVIYMGVLVTILPILVIYIFLSKFIIAGIAFGGIKE